MEELRVGHSREPMLFANWASANVTEFLASLGLTAGWWCALNLPRSEVFDEPSSGDIDVLAGPIELKIGARELNLMAREERRAKPHYSSGMAVNAALIRVGREGLIKWPPEVGYTVGVEVKASYYDGLIWKAQHVEKGTKILGALRQRRDRGINDLTFMHLGIVRPATSAEHMDEMFAAAGASFPTVFDGPDLGEYGYYRYLLAGVERDNRTIWGGLGGGWVRASTPRPYRPQPWHTNLEARLGTLPPPHFFRTFIVRCAACGTWRHAADADPSGMRCQCGTALGWGTPLT